jgi:hypothetical protein
MIGRSFSSLLTCSLFVCAVTAQAEAQPPTPNAVVKCGAFSTLLSEDFIKILTSLVTSAFLSLTVASSFAPAFAAPPKWTCSSAKADCIKLYAGSPELAAKCESGRAGCMSTGTFVGPKGKAFPGAVRK